MNQTPQFKMIEGLSRGSFSDTLAALWETDPPVQTASLYHIRPWPRDHRAVPGVFTSVLLHFAVLFFLLRFPWVLVFSPRFAQPPAPARDEELSFILHKLTLSEYFPGLKPEGLGGRSGRGDHFQHIPVLGSTAAHGALSVVSNPADPNNDQQTVLQPSFPHERKNPPEAHPPNLFLAAAQAPAPAVPSPVEALPIVDNTSPLSTIAMAMPATAILPVTPPVVTSPRPSLPVTWASPSPSAPVEPSIHDDRIIINSPLSSPTSKRMSEFLSLGMDPAAPSESIPVRAENSQAVFSISPAGANPGSPGGKVGGDSRGGTGGKGSGGDASTGLGPSNKGGGGGEGAFGGGVSIIGGTAGGEGTASAANHIDPNGQFGSRAADEEALPSLGSSNPMVYAVIPPAVRHAAVMISAGPSGGGGLHAYNVLKGGKIYTIYLSMPGRDWVLQYCARGLPETGQPRQQNGAVIQLDPGLVPPVAEQQFDFHRPPLAPEEASDMLILQGVIGEDGAVSELRVLQGLFDSVDRVAMAAFSRWRFKPALRANKPVAIQFLVGIPALLPGT